MSNEKKPLNKKLIAIIAAVLVVIIVVSVVFVIKNKNTDGEEITTETTTVEETTVADAETEVTTSEEKVIEERADKTDYIKQNISSEKISVDKCFYQFQQYNIQHGFPLTYDKHTIYFYRGTTEYGGWINCTDDIHSLKVFLNIYSDFDLLTFMSESANGDALSICMSDTKFAVAGDYIYYIRSDFKNGKLLCRNSIKSPDNNEIKNFSEYYDEKYNETNLRFMDEEIFELSKYTDYRFILSEKYIYILVSESNNSKIIRMYHDGSNQTVVMTGIADSDTISMYTIESDMYFVYEEKLYCNFEKSDKCVAVCNVGKDVELVEALGDKLYLRHAEIYKSYMLHSSYKQTIYEYTPENTKLMAYESAIIDGRGRVFVDPKGTVLFVCGDEGASPTYILKNGVVTQGVVLHMDYSEIFIYKDVVLGISADGEKLVTVHKY